MSVSVGVAALAERLLLLWLLLLLRRITVVVIVVLVVVWMYGTALTKTSIRHATVTSKGTNEGEW
jgi:hypothetical protein